jgi:chemotaxis protein MotB
VSGGPGRRKRRGHHGGGHGGGERWLITYADLITLLMAFFIMMYSLGQMDLAKFKSVQGGLRAAASNFGIIEGGGGIVSGGDGVLPGGASQNDNVTGFGGATARTVQGVSDDLSRFIQAKRLSADVSVRVTREGLVVSVAGPLLFDSGSTHLRPQAEDLLHQLADVLRRIPAARVRVEGHADSAPISTPQYPSNWELSSARAGAVVRWFVTRYAELDGPRFAVVGYGSARPVHAGDDPRSRAANRRVEIVLVKAAEDR